MNDENLQNTKGVGPSHRPNVNAPKPLEHFDMNPMKDQSQSQKNAAFEKPGVPYHERFLLKKMPK